MKYQATLTTKARILEALRSGGEEFASWLATLSDETWPSACTSGGRPAAQQTRFEMLLSPKEHEMHHRAQLMLVERMLASFPTSPGTSRPEWPHGTKGARCAGRLTLTCR